MQFELNDTFTNASGRVTVDMARVPPASVNNIFQYGLNHFLGNVQQSKLGAEIKRKLAEESNSKATAVTGQMVSAYRKAQGEAWELEQLTRLENEGLAEIYSGTIGVREAAAPRDPVMARAKRLVEAEVRSIVESKGMKLPKDDSVKVEWGKDRITGAPVYRTRTEFLTNGWNSFGEKYMAIAREQLAQEAAAKAEAAQKAAEHVDEDLEALGV